MLIVGANAAIPNQDGSGEARGADAKWPKDSTNDKLSRPQKASFRVIALHLA